AADSDELVGDNVANSWTVTGAGTGTVTGVTTGFSGIEKLTGGTNNDSFTISAGGSVATIDGGTGNHNPIGPNATTTWNVTGANAGNIVSAVTSFTNIQNLTGGTQVDTFNIAGDLTGTLQGGSGDDIFNYTNGTIGTLRGGAVATEHNVLV